MDFGRFRFPLYVNGLFLVALAAAMLVPAVIDLLTGSGKDAAAFFTSAAIVGLIGAMFALALRRSGPQSLDRRTGFLVTVSSWLSISLLGALPLKLSTLNLSLTDAVFETTSALTTTGATVLAGLDTMPKGLLLWRSLLQWLGGIGIVVMALIILPQLRVGGMQFFKTESSDISEKPFARVGQMARAIGIVYFSLTALCAVGLLWAGMDLFDAINHAMATIATGGFSTHDASIGYFHSPRVEVVTEIFMVSGALPLAFYALVLMRRPWRRGGKRAEGAIDGQIPVFLMVTALAIGAATIWNISQGTPAGMSLRLSAFNVISILTDTGFATSDFSAWGNFAIGLFFLLFLVGGCAGSTAGAIKIFRWQILFAAARANFRRMLYPHGVFTTMYQGRKLDEDSVGGVRNFFFLYIMTLIVLSLAMMATGLDFLSATSAIAQGMANAGPGLGPLVGPATNFAAIPASAKWIVMLAMELGRLELVTFYVVVLPEFWRG